MTVRPGKLEGVEAARGGAALLVVWVHVTSMLLPSYGTLVFGGLLTFGHAGVDFFFVLSGFIITYVHSRDLGQPALFWQFWQKRLWRIYPVYWFAALCFFALLLYSPTANRAERDIAHLFASLFLLPETAAPVLEVGWSLRHELLFYAVFGVLILHFRAGVVLLLAWAGGIAFNTGAVLSTGVPYFTGVWNEIVFRMFNLEFFFGMAVALLVRKPAWQPRLLFWLGITLFLGTGLLESLGPRLPAEWPPRHLGYAAGAAAILYGTACLDQARAWSVPRWALVLGGASYSIYLVHVPIVLVVTELIRRSRTIVPIPIELAFTLASASAILAGLIVHRLVERPVMRYARQANQQSARPSSVAVPAQPGLRK